MAIALGWRRRDVRESFWKGDPDVESVLPEYENTGDRAHVVVKPGGNPTRITFRALTRDELALVEDMTVDVQDGESAPVVTPRLARRRDITFRIACDLPDMPAELENPLTREKVPHRVTEHGHPMMSAPMFDAIAGALGGDAIRFYARLVLEASQLSRGDFFPSSPPSTTTVGAPGSGNQTGGSTATSA